MSQIIGQTGGLIKTQYTLQVKNGQEGGTVTIITTGFRSVVFPVIHQVRAPGNQKDATSEEQIDTI